MDKVAAAAPNGDGAVPTPAVVSVAPAAPVRFRRGSRIGTHKPEIPMVGVVRVDDDGAGKRGSGKAAKMPAQAAKAPKPAAEKPAAAPKKKAARKPRAKKAE